MLATRSASTLPLGALADPVSATLIHQLASAHQVIALRTRPGLLAGRVDLFTGRSWAGSPQGNPLALREIIANAPASCASTRSGAGEPAAGQEHGALSVVGDDLVAAATKGSADPAGAT